LYALTKCHLLERLQAEDTLENIKRVYGDIQQAAWKMTCVFRNSPNAKTEPIMLKPQLAMLNLQMIRQLIELKASLSTALLPLSAVHF
jgi:hypothetical protein